MFKWLKKLSGHKSRFNKEEIEGLRRVLDLPHINREKALKEIAHLIHPRDIELLR